MNRLTVADLLEMLQSIPADTELFIGHLTEPYVVEWEEQIPLRISKDGKRLYFNDWGEMEAEKEAPNTGNFSLWLSGKRHQK